MSNRDFNEDEKKMAIILKKLDFSQRSAAHKGKLWQSLNAQSLSESRALSDDEVDLIAAAGDTTLLSEEPEKPEKP